MEAISNYLSAITAHHDPCTLDSSLMNYCWIINFLFVCPVLLRHIYIIHAINKLRCFCLQIWWMWYLPSDGPSTYWCWVCTDNCGARSSSSYMSWRCHFFLSLRMFSNKKKRKENVISLLELSEHVITEVIKFLTCTTIHKQVKMLLSRPKLEQAKVQLFW